MTPKHKFIVAVVLITLASLADARSADEAMASGDYPLAIELHQDALTNDPDDAEALMGVGRAYLGLDEPKTAVQFFERAVAAAPGSAEAHYWLGASNGTLAANASVFRAGRYAKRALAGFEAALEAEPGHVEAHKGLITYYRNAPRIMGGDKDKALEVAESLIRFDELEGRLALAQIYLAEDQTDEALAALTSLTKTFPRDPRPFLTRGFHAQGDERYEDAHRDFMAAARGESDTQAKQTALHQALYQVGRTAVFSGQRIDDGIAAMQRYLELPRLAGTPEHAWARFRLGRLYDLADDGDQAQELYLAAREATDDRELLRQIRRHAD